MDMERYLVQKESHVGFLRRDLKQNSIIEWIPEAIVLKIDGEVIPASESISPDKAMHQLKGLIGTDNQIISSLVENKDVGIMDFVSHTLTVSPTLGCLQSVREHLSDGNMTINVVPSTKTQKEFFSIFGEFKSPDDFLRSVASNDTEEINKWLLENNFTAQFDEGLPQSIYASCMQDIFIEWLNEAERTSISYDGQSYPAIGISNAVVLSAPVVHPHPVALVKTKNDETVFISRIDGIPEGRFGLVELVHHMSMVKAPSKYKGVVVPMIDYNEEDEISSLEGLAVYDNPPHSISKAFYRTRFRMNEMGKKGEGSTDIDSPSMDGWPCVVDGPFAVWVQKGSSKFPIFVGVFCPDSWKDPAA